ncbi:SLOG domain-containing protein [Indioceanicola profundi]|uniref:SLOG domain-containing protein n=1 Tax=Indioceanicola profundi TaxID=2220096 RepID=UPI000E6A9E18|nr:hypothetical protein [Indioceanicola profundi]
MPEAVFLSAGVPDPRRGPEYAATADAVAITAAVSALVHVVLGRRLLVWGGHPAITPMVAMVAEAINVDYGRWVRLYQSSFFKDEYPEDNERFQNVVYTDAVGQDLGRSLQVMRERMFNSHQFAAAVFIGGMGGVVDEFDLFRAMHPDAAVVPVLSTGGAALRLKDRLPSASEDLATDMDYIALFHRHLEIPARERRYKRPEEQPVSLPARIVTPEGR